MIKYNINNNTIIPSEFTDAEGKLKNNLKPSSFLFHERGGFARLEFDKVYYAAIDRHFYAYKLLYITLEHVGIGQQADIIYHIQLADGRVMCQTYTSEFFSRETFSCYSYLENYIRYGDEYGRGLLGDGAVSLKELLGEYLKDGDIYLFEGIGATTLCTDMYKIGQDGRVEKMCKESTEFYAIWIDKEGFHAIINDKDGDAYLYRTMEECKQASRVVCDFDGVKHVKDMELIDGHVYKVWGKCEGSSYVFVKDSTRSSYLTSCICHCQSVEMDEACYQDYDELNLDDCCVFDDTEIQFIDDAPEEDVKKLKRLFEAKKEELKSKLDENEQNEKEIKNTLDMLNNIL